MSSKLPLHKGSHKKWDDLTEKIIEDYQNDLLEEYGKLDIPPIPEEVMKDVLSDIEMDLMDEIKMLPVGIKIK